MWQRRMKGMMATILAMVLSVGLAEGDSVKISPLNTPADLDFSGNIVYAINFGDNGNPRFGEFVFSQSVCEKSI